MFTRCFREEAGEHEQADLRDIEAVAELVGRHCAPDVEWYKELGSLLLSKDSVLGT